MCSLQFSLVCCLSDDVDYGLKKEIQMMVQDTVCLSDAVSKQFSALVAALGSGGPGLQVGTILGQTVKNINFNAHCESRIQNSVYIELYNDAKDGKELPEERAVAPGCSYLLLP